MMNSKDDLVSGIIYLMYAEITGFQAVRKTGKEEYDLAKLILNHLPEEERDVVVHKINKIYHYKDWINKNRYPKIEVE